MALAHFRRLAIGRDSTLPPFPLSPPPAANFSVCRRWCRNVISSRNSTSATILALLPTLDRLIRGMWCCFGMAVFTAIARCALFSFFAWVKRSRRDGRFHDVFPPLFFLNNLRPVLLTDFGGPNTILQDLYARLGAQPVWARRSSALCGICALRPYPPKLVNKMCSILDL